MGSFGIDGDGILGFGGDEIAWRWKIDFGIRMRKIVFKGVAVA